MIPDREIADGGLTRRQRALIDDAGRQVARMRARSSECTLDSPPAGGDSFLPPADAFAGYEILREVHRGAQGIVYQAFQKSTQRQVAIKVMKEGPFAGQADRARFEREVHILGRLDHPHIVTVHDSGVAAGCHYFVMDYVDGAPLDKWIADSGLRIANSGNRSSLLARASVREPLELFIEICDAVSAAHLKGVIHRDLKPGNIRIDLRGEPRILDFGLAALEDDRSSIRNSLPTVEQGKAGQFAIRKITRTGQFIGSLPWAAPEQARGDAHLIDVRTDVYALGVILFQMLTGEFPYSVIGPMGDVLDRITRAEPLRPSAAALRRGSTLRIDDELDTIVLQCLAKPPERRYQSAGELARDLRRYLAGEPIEAKRDSVRYVLRKHLSRYRVPIAIAAGFVLVVTLGFLVSLGLWQSAERNRGAAEANLDRARQAEALASQEAERARIEALRAHEEAQTATRVKEFMTRVFTLADPEAGEGESVTARQLLEAGAEQALRELESQPQMHAAMLETLGTAYRGLGMYERSIELLQRALELRRAGQRGLELAACLENLGDSLATRHDAAAIEPLVREALDIRRALQPPDHPDVGASLANLAETIRLQTQFDRALPLFDEALAILRPHAATEGKRLARCLNDLGLAQKARAEFDLAEASLREAVEVIRAAEGPRSPDYAIMLNNLALLLKARGDLRASEQLQREGLEIRQSIYGEDHPKVAVALNNLGMLLEEQEQFEQAEQMFKRCLDIRRRSIGPEHALIANTMDNLATMYDQMGRKAEAEPMLRDALDMRRKLQGPRHVETGKSLNNLANFLQNHGDPAGAEPLYRECLDIYTEMYGADHPTTALLLANLGTALADQQRFEEAEPLYHRALEIQRRKLGGAHVRVAGTLRNLADLLVRTGRADEAEPLFREAIEIEQTALPAASPYAAVTRGMLGACLAAQGRHEEAEPLLLQSYADIQSARGPDHSMTRKAVKRLVELYEGWNRPTEADHYRALLPPN